MTGTDILPEPYRYVCMACGKTARSKYGFDSDRKPTADQGWDTSCVLNSILCKPNPKRGTLAEEPEWVRAREDELPKPEPSPTGGA